MDELVGDVFLGLEDFSSAGLSVQCEWYEELTMSTLALPLSLTEKAKDSSRPVLSWWRVRKA